MYSSDSYSDSDSDGILTTKNVSVDFNSLEKKGAKIDLSDTGFEVKKQKPKAKPKFSGDTHIRRSKPMDAVSVASTRSSASKYSVKSSISMKSDQLSQKLFDLGVVMNIEQFELECKSKAEEQYNKMLEKNYSRLLENRKRSQENNMDDSRFNLSRDELYKMSRPQLIKENERLRTKIKTIRKQLEELNNDYNEVSSEISQLKSEYV